MGYRSRSLGAGVDAPTVAPLSALTSRIVRGPGGRFVLPPLQVVSAPARAPAPQLDPLSIIPPECSRFDQVATAPDQISAGTTVVTGWPTKATDAQVGVWFAQVLGEPVGSGGQALVRSLGSLPAGTKLTFVSAGFMRDGEASSSSDVNGVIWIAMAFDAQMSRIGVQRIFQKLMQEALLAPNGPTVRTARITLPIVSQQSDTDLQAAAMQSIVGQYSVASIFGALLGVVDSMARPASLEAGRFVSAANDMNNAVAALARMNELGATVNAAVSSALNAPTEQAAQLQTQLTAAKNDLAQLRSLLERASANAPALREAATNGRGAIALTLRQQVLSGVESKITSQPGVVREIARCKFLTMAEKKLRGSVQQINQALDSSLSAALTLIASDQQISQAYALINELNSRIDFALQQLPLAWYERDFHGAPMWAWVGGGVVVMLGGALVVKRLRKKSASAPAEVKKNRRRLR